MEIKLDIPGKILKGDHQGWYLYIKDDRKGDTGGIFFIVTENKSGEGLIYDSWIEKIEQLEQYFINSNWEIDWE